MDWLLLGALGIMWVAFLLPSDRRRQTTTRSVEDFEHRMELLANVEAQGSQGRWIVTPRKGARFVGVAERRRARVRERRRKVLVFLIESIGLTFLIGLVPPLRAVWYLRRSSEGSSCCTCGCSCRSNIARRSSRMRRREPRVSPCE